MKMYMRKIIYWLIFIVLAIVALFFGAYINTLLSKTGELIRILGAPLPAFFV